MSLNCARIRLQPIENLVCGELPTRGVCVRAFAKHYRGKHGLSMIAAVAPRRRRVSPAEKSAAEARLDAACTLCDIEYRGGLDIVGGIAADVDRCLWRHIGGHCALRALRSPHDPRILVRACERALALTPNDILLKRQMCLCVLNALTKQRYDIARAMFGAFDMLRDAAFSGRWIGSFMRVATTPAVAATLIDDLGIKCDMSVIAACLARSPVDVDVFSVIVAASRLGAAALAGTVCRRWRRTLLYYIHPLAKGRQVAESMRLARYVVEQLGVDATHVDVHGNMACDARYPDAAHCCAYYDALADYVRSRQ